MFEDFPDARMKFPLLIDLAMSKSFSALVSGDLSFMTLISNKFVSQALTGAVSGD
jgi:hypothetical protein